MKPPRQPGAQPGVASATSSGAGYRGTDPEGAAMVALALVRSGVLQRRHGSQARLLWNVFTNMEGNLHGHGERGERRRPADGDHLLKNNEQRGGE